MQQIVVTSGKFNWFAAREVADGENPILYLGTCGFIGGRGFPNWDPDEAAAEIRERFPHLTDEELWRMNSWIIKSDYDLADIENGEYEADVDFWDPTSAEKFSAVYPDLVWQILPDKITIEMIEDAAKGHLCHSLLEWYSKVGAPA